MPSGGAADFCAAITGLANPLSPGLPDTAQTSRGKIDRLHRTPAGFTTPALDGYGLRDHHPACNCPSSRPRPPTQRRARGPPPADELRHGRGAAHVPHPRRPDRTQAQAVHGGARIPQPAPRRPSPPHRPRSRGGRRLSHAPPLRLAGCELPLFEAPAVEALFQSARGLPRQINRIAHYALAAAALDKARTVNADHLQHALDELRP